MNIHHFINSDLATERKLDRIMSALVELLRRTTDMSAAMDRLMAVVSKNTQVSASVLALVEGLAQQIRDNVEDPVKLNALADEIENSANAEAAAVIANTPTPPEVPEEPVT